MARYHEVPADVIEGWLAGRSFRRTVQRNEVVYVRESRRDPGVKMKVYTSVSDGAAGVRRSGSDAIRVVVVFDDGRRSFGIGKFRPVFRVTSDASVLSRLEARLKEAAARANEWLDRNPPRSPPRRGPALPSREDLARKAEFARRERLQEEAALASKTARDVCPRCEVVRCGDGCCCGC